MKAEEIFKVEAVVLRHTEKAVQIRVHEEEIWIPRSQLFDDEELPDQGNAEVKMTAWIAKEKGLR